MATYTYFRWGLNLLELMACITGFFYWKKISKNYWRWFPVYLAVLFVTELAGKYVLYILKDKELNAQLYDYFGIPLQFLFFFWLFYKSADSSKQKRAAWIGGVFYVLCFLASETYFSRYEILTTYLFLTWQAMPLCWYLLYCS